MDANSSPNPRRSSGETIMATGGARIDLVTDTREIQRGFKTVGEALEDVSDALDDVATNGEDAGERLEKSFSDVAKETKKDARDMGREISGAYDKAADDSGEAMTQMKDDGFSNAKEVAASFDGSAESIVDGFQGAAAEMFSGFGPAGAAAGLAAAAGLGLISTQLEKQKEEAAEAEAAIWDMAQGAIDAGVYTVTELQKTEMLKAWLGDEDKRKEAQDFVNKFGGTVSDYLAGQLDLGDKRAQTEQLVYDYYERQRTAIEDGTASLGGRRYAAEGIEELQRRALEGLYSEDEAIQTANTSAQEVLQTFKDVGIEIFEWKEPTDDMIHELERMQAMDVTPDFDLTPAIKDAEKLLSVLQRAASVRIPSTRSVR